MTQIEIRRAIDLNNQLINTLLTPNQFTLNNEVARLLRENKTINLNASIILLEDIVNFVIWRKSK